jgi:hypothetical protein
LCDPGTPSCEPCTPSYPTNATAVCRDGHCTVEWSP